jgi:hypothetical protein
MAQYTVKWIIPAKNLIRFNEAEESFNIAEGVKTEGIKCGDSVGATIDNNIVVKMDIEKVEVKKEEVKSEEKAEESGVERIAELEVAEMTYVAGTSTKEVVKFSEDEKIWLPVLESVRSVFNGAKKGDIFKVTFGQVEVEFKGKTSIKKGIVDAEKKVSAEEPDKDKAEEPTPEKSKPRSNGSYRNEDETTRRTILMCAKDLTQALISVGKVDDVEKTLISVTESLKKVFETI